MKEPSSYSISKSKPRPCSFGLSAAAKARFRLAAERLRLSA
jgi:hypothetical protein